MAGFPAQVWVLCAVAFLAGSGVTWLLFVRPLRAAARRVVAAAPAVVPAPEPVREVPREEPRPVDPAAPPNDPALSALEAPARTRGTGARARDALDGLGVSPSGLAPTIPTQHGPADDDGPGR